MQDEPEAGAAETGREQGIRPFSARAEKALIASTQMALIPVTLLILAALGAFAYGIAVFIDGVRTVSDHPFPVGH